MLFTHIIVVSILECPLHVGKHIAIAIPGLLRRVKVYELLTMSGMKPFQRLFVQLIYLGRVRRRAEGLDWLERPSALIDDDNGRRAAFVDLLAYKHLQR